MNVPVSTVLGALVVVIERSAIGAFGLLVTVDVAVAWLFEMSRSVESLVTFAVFEMVVWSGTPSLTVTMIVSVSSSPAAIGPGHVAWTVPVPPTLGAATDEPVLAVAEVKVVFAGTWSVTTTFVASLGPSFTTEIV